MSQLHFYVPDKEEAQIRYQAKQMNLSISRDLAQLVKRETNPQKHWPEGYFELFDQWEGEPMVRPPQPPLEERMSFE